MSKVEVSAIMEETCTHYALAITPCATRVLIFVHECNRWFETVTGFRLWQANLDTNSSRKVYRGIFTIEVQDEK